MHWEPVCTNLMKIFITHNCARASWPSSPDLATCIPRFGHVWETIFSSVFLTKLFYHISFGCFHSTCSQEQCFLMKKGLIYGWIGAIKQSLGLGWVGRTTANQSQAPNAFCSSMTPVTDQSEASMLSCQPMESQSCLHRQINEMKSLQLRYKGSPEV